jgi:biopolymer transport protein ExbD
MFRFIFIGLLFVFGVSCASIKPTKFEPTVPKVELETEQTDINLAKNPIVVGIKADGKLFLNNKDYGSINDTTKLEIEVSRILAQNKKEFGDNEEATTVFVKAPRLIKYGDVVNIIDVLKNLGARPVGLQIDKTSE